MDNEIFEVKKEDVIAAYNAADEKGKRLILSMVFPDIKLEEHKPVTERIKTFADAYLELGCEHTFCKEYEDVQRKTRGSLSPDIIAYLKLRVICAALNEGWEPDENSTFWHPTFTDYVDVENGCAGCECAESVPCENYNLEVGIKLVLKSKELAYYCGKQFIDLWADFCLSKK